MKSFYLIAPASFVAFAALVVFPSSARQLFHSLGCGSGCSVEYFSIKGPYTGDDGLRKVLVKEVNTQYDEMSNPRTVSQKQVWILADCTRQKINLSSQSSNGRVSHADASGWTNVRSDNAGTHYDFGVRQLYSKLCRQYAQA